MHRSKKALAIDFSVKKFHHYAYGRKFLLVTDHKPLMTIFSPKASLPALAAARLQRWTITLSAYNYHEPRLPKNLAKTLIEHTQSEISKLPSSLSNFKNPARVSFDYV